MTTGKLDDQLEDKKTSIKFTNYAINNFQYDFTDTQGKSGAVKLESSGVKGLKLFQYNKSKRKYFIQQFWFSGRSDYWTIGEFRPNVYGVKECMDEVNEIMRTHTNSEGLWIKNPKITKRHSRERIKKAERENREMLTVCEGIVKLCEADFPKISREGTLTGKSALFMCLPLIGYNKRTQHLTHEDDAFGGGHITFKSKKKYNTVAPTSWSDLFNKFPPGYGIIKKMNGKELNDISVYDSWLGKYLIEDLTPGVINLYLDEKPRSWAKKRHIINALQTLWANSKKYMGTEKPLNPTTREALDVKHFGISKGKNTQYNKKKFTPKQLETIFNILQELSENHPFQAESFMLMLCSGIRSTEVLKIKKENIFLEGNKDNPLDQDNIIYLPPNITKNRKEDKIIITPPVKFVLDRLNDLYKRPELTKYKWVPWCFPSTHSSPKSWLVDGEINQEYINSRKTRLKDTRDCWRRVVECTGIKGVPRMLRKSYSTIAVMKLKTSAKAKNVTRHSKTATLDIHYDVHDQDAIRDYAHEVAEEFSYMKH